MKIDDLNNFYMGFGHFFPEGSPPKNEPFLKWKNRKDFVDDVKNNSGLDISSGNPKTIKDAQQKLFELTKKAEAPNEPTPDKFKREQQEAEREAREKAQAVAKQKGIDQTQAFLKQQQKRAQKLQEILKNQKLHAKVETKEPAIELPKEKAEAINKLREEAVQNPKAVAEQLAQEIKTRIAKDTPPEVLDAVANQTAYDAVQTMRGGTDSPVMQIAYFQAVAKNPEVIEKIVKNSGAVKETQNILQLLTDQKTSQLELSKQVFGSAFGEEAVKIIFAEPVVSISEVPAPGTQPVFLTEIPQQFEQRQIDQNILLENIKELGIDEAKTQIGKHVGGLIEKRIAALPEGHFLKNGFVSNTLGVFGVGTPVKWIVAEGASPVIRFAVSSGYGPILGAVQSATGWKLGITKIAAPAIGKAAAGIAAKTGLAATLSTAFAALGSWAPIIGNLIGAALGWIFGKILEKIPWKKVLPYIVGGILLPFLGPVAAIAGGLGTALIGGATLAGIGAGIGTFFWTLGRATAITIGAPIIVTLLVFPVIVALILFIINSGAYIVPPGTIGTSIIHIPPGGNLTKCDPEKTGADITQQLASSIRNGSVYLLPNSLGSRKDGICMDPTMIILHTSSGYDNDDGNIRTYETLVDRNVSCQLATDTNDTILMLNFFEKQVEFAWCADNLNAGGVSIEMAGEPDPGFGPFSKCAPTGDQTFTTNGPHPCPDEEDLSFDAICKTMQQYKIPWTQIFQHEASNGTHVDPNGDAWVDKFITRFKNNCPV